MTNLADCLDQARRSGTLDAEDVARVMSHVKHIKKTLSKGGDISPEHADLLGEQRGIALALEQLETQRRQQLLQVLALGRAIGNVKAHPRKTAAGVMSLLTKDLRGEAPWSNVEGRATTILAQAHAKMADVLNAYRPKRLGFSQDESGIRNMVRELTGTKTGDADAATFAKTWTDTAEWLRQRFNMAGGSIRKLTDWGLPQFHDGLRVKKVGRENWKNSIRQMIDPDRMVDETGLPITPDNLERALDTAFDRITTDGLVDLIPGKAGGSKLANRHQDMRFFVFKDGDSWLKYHDQFGHADIYTTLTDHLSRMAHETALMEILGPNPDATFRYLHDLARKDGAEGLRLAFLDDVYQVVSGKVNAVESVRLADFMGGVRHTLVAAKLGGAFLSSISDAAFQIITNKFNGLPAMGSLKRAMSLMNPANEADRLFAVRLGLTADAWINRALVANRFTEVSGAGFAAKISDATMRASLLSAWTDSGRKAFGMEFLGFIADQSGKEWKDLHPRIRGAMRRYGIGHEDWDAIRTTTPLEFNGAKFLRPEDIMRRTDIPNARQAAEKLHEMVLTETDFAVPTPDARVRAITTLGTRKGTIAGEITRSAFMFKSFPITVISTHLMRAALTGGLSDKAAYLSGLAIATTVLGAVAMQAKEMSRGKDPRPMDDAKFWVAAMAQGGGAGIFGDFLFSDANRFGRGPTMTLAGPVAELLDTTARFTVGNVQQAIAGKETNIGSEFVDLMRSYTPGGSLWYTRLAFERLLIDQLDSMADPGEARRGVQRLMRNRQKDFGQGFWWAPGEIAPDRAPDLSAAFGG